MNQEESNIRGHPWDTPQICLFEPRVNITSFNVQRLSQLFTVFNSPAIYKQGWDIRNTCSGQFGFKGIAYTLYWQEGSSRNILVTVSITVITLLFVIGITLFVYWIVLVRGWIQISNHVAISVILRNIIRRDL